MGDGVNAMAHLAPVEAERALVAAAFVDSEILDTHPVPDEAFWDDACRLLWREARRMRQEGRPVDLVAAVLGAGLPLEEAGRIIQYPTSPLSAGDYAGQVLEGWRRRRVYEAVLEAQRALVDGAPSASVLEGLARAVEQVRAVGAPGKPVQVLEAMERALERGMRLRERKAVFAFALGAQELATIGEGELHVIMAATGVGKSLIALQLAAQAAHYGWPSVIYSLEMSVEEVGGRYLAQKGVVRPGQLRRGEVGEDALERLDRVRAQVVGLPLYLEDRLRHADAIAADAARLRRELGVRLVVVDYLGLVELPHRPKDKRYQVLEELANRYKAFAVRHGLAVVLLHQLNRQGEAVAEAVNAGDAYGVLRPADGVYVLSRTKEGERRLGDSGVWKVEKSRHGELYHVRLSFDRLRLSFEALGEGY